MESSAPGPGPAPAAAPTPAPEGGGPAAAAPGRSLFSRRRFRIGFLALTAAATLLLAYRLRDVLNPFLVALLIAYILHPLVKVLEQRGRLPRTAAVAVIYIVALGAVVAVVAYSIGKTTGEVDRLMTRAAGGWQRVHATAPGAGGGVLTGDAEARPAPPAPLVPEPVIGDDRLTPMQGSATIFFLDLDADGGRDPAEPTFIRAASGAWIPNPHDPVSAEWKRMPGYLDEIKHAIARRYALIDPKLVESVIERAKANTASIASAGAAVWKWITDQLFGGIVTAIGYILLVPIYTFFLLRGLDAIVERVDEYLPGLHRDRIRTIARRIDRACSAFFRGRVLICLGKALFIWLGLWAIGVEFSLTIGLVAGALSLVPGAGPVVGFALAAIFAYGPTGYGLRLVQSAAVFVAAEVLEAIANPVVLGREVGLHPVTILIALFVFGDLFGLFGVLLAVPLAAIVKILAQELVLPELKMLAAEAPGTRVSGWFRKVEDV